MYEEPPSLLTPAEVGTKLRLDPKTVTRWAQKGYLDYIKTLGGHRRYPEAQIQAMLGEPDPGPLLTPAEVANLFGVGPKTVTRWATTGKLEAIRLTSGHRRYSERQVFAIIRDSTTPIAEQPANCQEALSLH